MNISLNTIKKNAYGKIFLLGLLIVGGLLWTLPSGTFAVAPAGFTETLIAQGMTPTTAMKFAPDGRLFVLEQSGAVRVIKGDSLLPTPFTTFSVDNSVERGLLGIAFDPNFLSNHYIYFYYTATNPTTHNRLVRVTANGDVMLSGSETVLLDFPTLVAGNHNGGALNFGNDGKLYIALGENGVNANSQSFNTVLGKILRVNTDGSIPTDNPFYGSTTGMNRAIWALGLRNPFTFDVQPGTGKIYINDVGGAVWEEINEGAAGANYGWPTTEGPTTNPSFVGPIFAYGHGNGGATTGCSIVGGAFYNPSTVQYPSTYVGKYFFADVCSGWIRLFDPATQTASGFITGASNPVDLEVDAAGSLYYLTRHQNSSGRVYKVTYGGGSGPTPPSIIVGPANQTVSVGATATFSVSVSGTPPFTYQWSKNGATISGATSANYTTPATVAGDNGAQYTVRITNAGGNVTSAAGTLTLTSNRAPVATITTPASGALYSAGNTISFSGSATDPEQGALPASALSWRVLFHHNDIGGEHTHPVLGPLTNVTNGSFLAPTIGETSVNVWYRVYLTATDAEGLTHVATRDINPRVAQITLATVPSGLQINLDGQPQTTPVTISSVVGTLRNLEVPTPQTQGGTSYQFSSWSDGLARVHDISSPTSNTTYTATLTAVATGPVCGNGVIEGTEQCDGTNLNSQSCTTQGFTGGTLSCSACAFVTSACTNSTGTITTLTLTPRIEGLTTVANRSVTISFRNRRTRALSPTYTINSGTDGRVVLTGLTLSSQDRYDIRVSSPNVLARIILDQPASAPTLPLLPAGDLNGDRSINSLDWSVMNTQWGATTGVSDINRDGLVNSIDFSFLNKNWMLVGE